MILTLQWYHDVLAVDAGHNAHVTLTPPLHYAIPRCHCESFTLLTVRERVKINYTRIIGQTFEQ